jgi:20S proteasome alpha/beta subunit
MTLAMALRAVDGLVLATDSRITGRGGTADTSEKFLQVNRDIGVLTYGLAQPGYEGISQLVSEVNQNRWAHFSKIAGEAARIFQNSYESWLAKQREKQFHGVVGFILAGYDNLETNQFRIMHYEITPDPEQPFRKRSIPGDLLAAQWHIARYLLTKFYYPEMTVSELAELAVFLIAETMIVEETVGGPIQMATVTQTAGFQRVHQQDIVCMLQSYQERFAHFNQICRSIAFEQSVMVGRQQ